MHKIQYTQWLPYSAAALYQALTDPDALAAIVARIQSARVIARDGETGKVAVTLDLPARRTIETVGDVVGQPNEYLTFRTHEPFPLEFAWHFRPAEQNGQDGTEVLASLGVDFSVFGIPMPGMMVQGIIQGELKEDMSRLNNWLKERAS